MAYFIAETDANAVVNNKALWKPTKANTLAGAKRAAQCARAFQGTAAHVAKMVNGDYMLVATRYPKGHIQAGWVDTE